MSLKIRLSVDAMGGDYGPRLSVAAALTFLHSHPDTSIHLFGNENEIRACLPQQNIPAEFLPARLRITHTEIQVDMVDKPGKALRQKQGSSMWLALESVASGESDACISAGNTGALMVMGRHLLKTIEGIDRPAICKPMPTAGRPSYLLDLGANLDCSAEQLRQFAVMGSALAKVGGRDHPEVALLNVGSEHTKGNEEIQKAAELIRQHRDIVFKGFIEGDDLYSGKVDVVVCDGFIGNVALKVSEGLARFVFSSLNAYLNANPVKKILVFILKPLFLGWSNKFNPSSYNGAILLGLKKIVIKSHGGASQSGFIKALESAREHVIHDIPSQIQKFLR